MLIEQAKKIALERGLPYDMVIKEVMHFDVLAVLMDSNISSNIVFQGGTALRLCYGGVRLSEDLDFVCGAQGVGLNALLGIDKAIRKRFKDLYDLEVRMDHPTEDVAMKRWRVRLYTPTARKNEKQQQFISLEIMNVPSYDNAYTPIRSNYPELPTVNSTPYVWAESMAEILADKIVALGARPYNKWRDYWDVAYLADKSITANAQTSALVNKKLSDYQIENTAFQTQLMNRIELCLAPTPDTLRQYAQEMLRFLPSKQAPHFLGAQHTDKVFSAVAQAAQSYLASTA